MLRRALPRTLNLAGSAVRSPALLTLAGGGNEVTYNPKTAINAKLLLTSDGISHTGVRCLSSGSRLRCKDPSGGFANDPQVKEWMKELQQDFSQHSHHQQEEELLVKSKTEERKEEEEDVVDGRTEKQEEKRGSEVQKVWSQLVAEKYHRLESHTQIIYDYDEEKLRREAGITDDKVQQEKVKLERGETGVFDVEELVELLREDNAQDLVVIQLPPELMYAQYMVITTSASQRHRNALAELVRAAYKLKKHPKDHSLITEGKATDWVALDMGNIVLHIMKPETRENYDLETLWTVGAAFDEKSQVSEEDLVGVRRPRDPLAPPPSPPVDHTATVEAVT